MYMAYSQSVAMPMMMVSSPTLIGKYASSSVITFTKASVVQLQLQFPMPLSQPQPQPQPLSLSKAPNSIRRILCCSSSSSSSGSTSELSPTLKTSLDKLVTSHKVVLFIKGTKDFPQCGFSNTVVQILNSLDVPFETINILENQLLRQALKEYSTWPTFPQLYIDGDFFGGCDITLEAYKSGELQELLEKALCS